MAPDTRKLVYDWNRGEEESAPETGGEAGVQLNDETLRDGLQSPSAKMPPLESKHRLLHILVKLGIASADIGLPASGPKVFEDTLSLAKEIADQRLPLVPNCAARTLESDIRPIEEIAQRSGAAIEVAAFLGASAARMRAEDWDLDHLLALTRNSLEAARRAGLSVMYVTEDTTRTHPEVLRRLVKEAVEHGARRICAADTVGFATPKGAARLVLFLKKVVEETGERVAIDWHGHMDRGLGLISTLAAMEAGADRLHGSALGLGERSGNTPLDLLLVNLKLMGRWPGDLASLGEYVEWVPRWTGVPIPWNYPVFGSDAFRTGTGVHASAIAKAKKAGSRQLVDTVYSAVPAHWVGRRQTIEIGPMSGEANIVSWLEEHGEAVTDARVRVLLRLAKAADTMLTEEEIRRAMAGEGETHETP